MARRQDSGSDLWAAFNRVQENAIQGGLTGPLSPLSEAMG
jgi:hypothetical protein